MLDVRERLLLYFVVDPEHVAGDLVEVVVAALRGGVTAVQLRCKQLPDREIVELARRLQISVSAAGALFLINDRVDIALAVEADGVHLGVDDLQLDDVRRLGGPDFVIGYSPETDAQTIAASSRGANYLGVGPVFGTATKSDAGPAIGLDLLRRRVVAAGVPVLGIGGINAGNARSVVDAGAAGVAVVSAISQASEPELAAQELRLVLDS